MSDTRGGRGRGGRNGHEPRARIRSRELRALELSTKGFTQVEIAAELNVSQAAVSKMLRRVEDGIVKELMPAFERQRARQLIRLEHIYNESMRGYERSKGDRKRQLQRRIQNGTNQGPTIVELVAETEYGNPQFLEVGRKALADERKLMGLNAPLDTHPKISRDPYADLSDEEVHSRAVKSAERILEFERVSQATPPLVTEPKPQDLEQAYAAELERRKRNGGGP